MKTVADRLREHREKMKMTAEDAAARIGVDAAEYLGWEAGEAEPDTENLLRAAKLFKTTGNELLYGRDGMGSRTMFPKDGTPSVTPISDWRFLSGVLLTFAGGAGILMFIMRYMTGAVNTVAKLLEVGGAWLIALISLFVLGILICIVSCVLRALENKKKRNKKKK